MPERVCGHLNFESMISDERKSCLRKQLSKEAKNKLIDHLAKLHTSLHSRAKGELYHAQQGGGSADDHKKMFRSYLKSLFKKFNGCDSGRISAEEMSSKLSVDNFKRSGGGLFGPSKGKKLPNGYQLDRGASIPPVCKGGGDKKSGGFRKSRGDRWGTSARCPDTHPYETPDGNCTNVPPSGGAKNKSGGALPSQKSRGDRWGRSTRCPDTHPYETPEGDCTNVQSYRDKINEGKARRRERKVRKALDQAPPPNPRLFERARSMFTKPAPVKPAPALQRANTMPKWNPSTNIPPRAAPRKLPALPAPPAKLSLFQRAKKYVTGKDPVVAKKVKSPSMRAEKAPAPMLTRQNAIARPKPAKPALKSHF